MRRVTESVQDPILQSEEEQRWLLQAAQVGFSGGLPLHALSPAETAVLAEYCGVYITTEPRHTPDFFVHRRHAKVNRVLAQLATNTECALRGTPAYEDAEVHEGLGHRAASVLSAIKKVHVEGIHIVEVSKQRTSRFASILGYMSLRPRRPDGLHHTRAHRNYGPDFRTKVVADSIELSVDSAPEADVLSCTLQALMRSRNRYSFRSILNDDNTWTVRIENAQEGIDEYVPRIVSNALTQLIAREDARRGITIPRHKAPLRYWLQEGTTFPEIKMAELVNINRDYQRQKATLTATYRDYAGYCAAENPRPRTNPETLGSEPAAVFEVIRDAFNGLIYPLRGSGGRRNLEQNPNTKARLFIEDRVHLRRRPVAISQSEGVPSPRALTIKERLQAALEKTLDETQGHRVYAVLKLAAKGAGIGISSVIEVMLHGAPHAYNFAKNFIGDYREWRQSQQAVAASTDRIRYLIRDTLQDSS